MPGERGSVLHKARVVAKRKVVYPPRVGLAMKAQRRGRRSRFAIMVAFDQYQLERCIPFAPLVQCRQRRRRVRLTRVKQVSEKNDRARLHAIDQLAEACQSVRSRAVRHWYAECAERSRFSEMHVRQNEPAAFAPECRALRRQYPGGAADPNLRRGQQ